MSRLREAFKGHKALIPFVVANYPNARQTIKNVVSLAEAGADIIELGIPFSDPIADGPVIQAADVAALADGKLTTDQLFEMVKEIRRQTQVPLVFLTYLNIVYQYGYDRFVRQCHEVGIDGLVIPDLPLEHQPELAPVAAQYQVDLVPLVTPTSGDRVAKIAQSGTAFIYVVSSLGITGERTSFDQDLVGLIRQIRQYTDCPTAIGFGIHTPEQATEMARIADGVIIGSAFVRITEEEGEDVSLRLKKYGQTIRSAIDS